MDSHIDTYEDGSTETVAPLNAWEGPAILLVDLDAFFASVEQLDHPGWRGKPVIVGGGADRRGVVSTASYEARKFGVRSAMPSSTARKLCPDAIWTEGHFNRYREISNRVMSILADETYKVQQVSIDEAFLDVTQVYPGDEHPVTVARRIQQRVSELGVTCSIGVGTSKSIAKIASEQEKPQGLTIVLPGSEYHFLENLPVRALSGVGPAAESALQKIGIRTLGDLYNAEDEAVVSKLGKVGRMVLNRVRGLEDSLVEPSYEVKSVSNEMSFAENMTDLDDIRATMAVIAAKVGRRLRRKGLRGSTIMLKLRYGDFGMRTAQRQIPEPTDDDYAMRPVLEELLATLWRPGDEIRLIGVAVSGFEGSRPRQLSLFDDAETAQSDYDDSKRSLLDVSDSIKERFGEDALRFGRELRLGERGTGSSTKNPADYK